jgi:hypothetical protein
MIDCVLKSFVFFILSSKSLQVFQYLQDSNLKRLFQIISSFNYFQVGRAKVFCYWILVWQSEKAIPALMISDFGIIQAKEEKASLFKPIKGEKSEFTLIYMLWSDSYNSGVLSRLPITSLLVISFMNFVMAT